MIENYVLDTSALFTFIESEDGEGTVEKILVDAGKGKCRVFLSFISLLEVSYVTWQEKGEDEAKEIVVLVKSLPVQIVESCERIILSSGRIKANHRLSLADAIVTATAMDQAAVLVHKDPELQSVASYVKTISLPYKSKK